MSEVAKDYQQHIDRNRVQLELMQHQARLRKLRSPLATGRGGMQPRSLPTSPPITPLHRHGPHLPTRNPQAPRLIPTPRARPSSPRPGNSTPTANRPCNPMPPPPVPSESPRKLRQSTITPTSISSAGEDDDKPSVMSVLDANNQAIQDKIALLMAGSRTSSNPASPISRRDDERAAQLEKEIESLRAEVRDKTAAIAEEEAVLTAAIERAVALDEDKRVALERITELEGANSSVADVQKAKEEAEARLSDVESKMKETESRLAELEAKLQDSDKKLVEAQEKSKDAESERTEAESSLEASKSSHTSELTTKSEKIVQLETHISSLETDRSMREWC